MKSAVENNAATKSALDFDKTFSHEENRSFLIKERKTEIKTGRKVRKIEVAEAESHSCGEQRLAKMGVARWNLPDQSASSKRRTPDTGMIE